MKRRNDVNWRDIPTFWPIIVGIITIVFMFAVVFLTANNTATQVSGMARDISSMKESIVAINTTLQINKDEGKISSKPRPTSPLALTTYEATPTPAATSLPLSIQVNNSTSDGSAQPTFSPDPSQNEVSPTPIPTPTPSFLEKIIPTLPDILR